MATGASGCDVYAIFLNWTSKSGQQRAEAESFLRLGSLLQGVISPVAISAPHTKGFGAGGLQPHPIQDEGFEAVTLRKIADVTASFCFLCGWP